MAEGILVAPGALRVSPGMDQAYVKLQIIDQPEVIEEILLHLGLWPGSSHSPPEAAAA